MPQIRKGKRGGLQHRRVELRPAGADGSAAVTHSLYTGPCIVTHIAVDYQNQPATTDLVIKRDTTSGTTLFTNANSATDIAIRAVATPGAVDEGNAVTAATDGVDGGWFVTQGLFFDVAQGDGQTSGDERIVIDLWYEEHTLLEVALRPVGADGSAAVDRLVKMHSAGVIKGLWVNYTSQPVTTDLTIKVDVLDDKTGGSTVFSAANTATDIGPTGLGCIGIDEANAAVAATDAISGGQPFRRNIFFDVAQGDGQTTGDELIEVKLWIDQ